jgi:hypothetical protein
MKKLISIAFALLFMMSCRKDFIDLIPISSVSVDILYKTDKDFLDALTATYNTFQTQYQNMYIFSEMRADDAWEQISKSNSQSYSDQFTMYSSDGVIASTWQNYYRAISAQRLFYPRSVLDAAAVQIKNVMWVRQNFCGPWPILTW